MPKMLAQSLIKPYPIIPIFGPGTYRIQPTPVEDLAAAYAQALTCPDKGGKTYCAVGKDSYTYIELIDILTRSMGLRPKPKLKLPLGLVRSLVHATEKRGLAPISSDDLEMLILETTGDSSAFYRDFDLPTPRFVPENMGYLQQYA